MTVIYTDQSSIRTVFTFVNPVIRLYPWRDLLFCAKRNRHTNALIERWKGLLLRFFLLAEDAAQSVLQVRFLLLALGISLALVAADRSQQ